MKYLCLICAETMLEQMPEAEAEKHFQEYAEFNASIKKNGHYLGANRLKPSYEWCLLKELELRGLKCVSQQSVLIKYKGFTREEPLRFDVLVEGCLLVEAKAVEHVLPIHKPDKPEPKRRHTKLKDHKTVFFA